MAERADRHIFYEESVQCAEAEMDFIDKTFSTLRGRKPVSIREDFCGTTNASCEWVRRGKNNTAHCVDIDNEVLEWGRKHHVARLAPGQAKRLHIYNEDVMKVDTPVVDTVLAMNFSYWCFKDRETMKRYYRRVHKSLVDDGILFLDAFGGYEAFREMEERTKFKGFTYIWDQSRYNPITGDARMHIHFKFKDGSSLRKAFTYDWRLWTLPEIREVLLEAGFRKATVYWEGTDEETQEGNGEFTPQEHGEADDAFIVYIVAEK